MTPFVLDCSVALAWCFEDDSSGYADEVFKEFRRGAGLVPSHWTLEAANVLAMAERRKQISATEMSQFVEWLETLRLETDLETGGRAMQGILSLAREHRLTAYDAAYLELAMRRGIPLATLDGDLRKAAKKSGVILLAV